MSKILLSIPDTLLEAVDQFCARKQYERSELIRQAVREMIYPKDISPKSVPLTGTPASENISKNIPENIPENTTPKTLDDMGFCKLHWEPVKGKTYPIKVITWEDENGIAVVDKKEACPNCIKKYENIGRGRVYYIDG